MPRTKQFVVTVTPEAYARLVSFIEERYGRVPRGSISAEATKALLSHVHNATKMHQLTDLRVKEKQVGPLMTCPKCNYRWHSTAGGKRVSCPNCKAYFARPKDGLRVHTVPQATGRPRGPEQAR